MRSCPTTRTRILPPVALIARSFNIVVVNPASPIKSIADLIAAAKAEPGQALLRHLRHRHFGASGRRTVQAHGQGQSDDGALQGRGARDHRPDRRPDRGDLHDGGKRRVAGRRPASCARIAVTSAERSPAFPQLPTVSEAGVPGYAAEAWYGLYAPGQDAARDHRPPQQVGGESRSVRGIQEAWRQTKASSWWQSRPHALDRYFARRGRALAQGDRGRRDQGRIGRFPTRFPDRGSRLGWPACM